MSSDEKIDHAREALKAVDDALRNCDARLPMETVALVRYVLKELDKSA